MNKLNKELKTKKWQDITIEDCHKFGYMESEESIPALDFNVASALNAVAYEVHGDGIDVRCHYADEAVGIWKSTIQLKELMKKYLKSNWNVEYEQNGELSLFKNWEDGDGWDNIFINYENDGSCGYMTMRCSTDKHSVLKDYYDYEEETVHSLLEKLNAIMSDKDVNAMQITDNVRKFVRARLVKYDIFGGEEPTREKLLEWVLSYEEDNLNEELRRYGMLSSYDTLYMLEKDGRNVLEILNDTVGSDCMVNLTINQKTDCCFIMSRYDKTVYVNGYDREKLANLLMGTFE